MKSHEGIEMVECPPIDRDNISLDSSGYYFLIRVNFRYGTIEVAVCHPEKGEKRSVPEKESENGYSTHPIQLIYYGRCAQDIYWMVLNKGFVKSYTHAAYLGKELKKAEMALVLGIQKFYQE